MRFGRCDPHALAFESLWNQLYSPILLGASIFRVACPACGLTGRPGSCECSVSPIPLVFPARARDPTYRSRYFNPLGSPTSISHPWRGEAQWPSASGHLSTSHGRRRHHPRRQGCCHHLVARGLAHLRPPHLLPHRLGQRPRRQSPRLHCLDLRPRHLGLRPRHLGLRPRHLGSSVSSCSLQASPSPPRRRGLRRGSQRAPRSHAGMMSRPKLLR